MKNSKNLTKIDVLRNVMERITPNEQLFIADFEYLSGNEIILSTAKETLQNWIEQHLSRSAKKEFNSYGVSMSNFFKDEILVEKGYEHDLFEIIDKFGEVLAMGFIVQNKELIFKDFKKIHEEEIKKCSPSAYKEKVKPWWLWKKGT